MVKWVAAHHTIVMRGKPKQYPATAYGPKPAYSAGQTIVGTAVFVGILLVVVFAFAYPVAVAGIVVGVIVARRAIRVAHRLRQRRHKEGRTRHLCIPMTDVCVEA